MTLEDFYKNVLLIKKDLDFNSQLYKIGIDTPLPNSISVAIELLEKVMEDNETKWISYWIFECDFGRDSRGRITINNKPIKFDTIEDLYYLLKGEERYDY